MLFSVVENLLIISFFFSLCFSYYQFDSYDLILMIRGTNTIKLYQELRLEPLQNKRKLRRLSLLYKIYIDQSPLYLYILIPAKTPDNCPLQNVKEILTIKVKHRCFENSFFRPTITERNDLYYSLRNASFINVFKQNIFSLFASVLINFLTFTVRIVLSF